MASYIIKQRIGDKQFVVDIVQNNIIVVSNLNIATKDGEDQIQQLIEFYLSGSEE